MVAIKESRYAVSDASRAIQSMVLTAWAEGIGSNWVGFFGLEAVKPLLGIPADLDVLAIVPFATRRRPLGRGSKTANRWMKSLPGIGLGSLTIRNEIEVRV